MIVLDANAALAITIESEFGKDLESLIENGEKIIAPSLIYSEISHAVTKYIKGNHLSQKEAIEWGSDALNLIDETIDDSDIWIEATTEAIRLKHSSYDMFYLILARRTGSTLFTLDRKLQQLCMENNVDCVYLAAI